MLARRAAVKCACCVQDSRESMDLLASTKNCEENVNVSAPSPREQHGHSSLPADVRDIQEVSCP